MLKRKVRSSVPAKKRRGLCTVAKTDEDYTDLARSLVLSSWPYIIQGLIDKALDGGYQQTKLLLELCGLTKVDARQITDSGKQQLCDALLNELQINKKRADDCDRNLKTSEEKPISQDGNEKHTKP